MQKLKVQLNRPLRSIETSHHVSFVTVQEGDLFGQEPPKTDAVLQVAKRIGEQLASIENTIARQNSQVKTAAAAYAIEMLQMLMQQDDELIRSRVERYIELAMQQAQSQDPPTVFVHPAMIEPVTQYLRKADADSCRLQAEAKLPVTDCRIEFVDSGLIASLPQQMGVVAKRLTTAIAEGAIA